MAPTKEVIKTVMEADLDKEKWPKRDLDKEKWPKWDLDKEKWPKRRAVVSYSCVTDLINNKWPAK